MPFFGGFFEQFGITTAITRAGMVPSDAEFTLRHDRHPRLDRPREARWLPAVDASSHFTDFLAASQYSLEDNGAVIAQSFLRRTRQLPDSPRHAHRIIGIGTCYHSKRGGYQASSLGIRPTLPRIVFGDAMTRRLVRYRAKK